MQTQDFLDVQRWADQQWSQSDFGDPRRTARAVALGVALAQAPEASLPKQTGSWGALKAAYRLPGRAEVHPYGRQPAALAAHTPTGACQLC